MRNREVIDGFLAAVVSREAKAVGAMFTLDATYRNMPHPPAIGPSGVEAMFSTILGRAEKVQWDVVSRSEDGRLTWLERVDRFWIDGAEYAIECNGVYEVDLEQGLILSVRDYVDLGLWRERLGDVLEPGSPS
jgi:limonene-1,2-epoxide hydrolase